MLPFPRGIKTTVQNCPAHLLLEAERMRSLVILMTVTLLLAGQSEGARLRREAVCSSPTCRDCKESCEGCDKCPLCVLVLPSCNKGHLLPSL